MNSKEKTILGIDEAGRGSVIGPLVICGVLVEESKIELIKDAKDSKLLSPKKREILEKKLKEVVKDFAVIKISSEEIDKLRSEKNLNKIEIENMQKIINLFNPDVVIIDSPEKNVKKFEKKIREKIRKDNIKIICENYADKKYKIVGAASIIAKVERDREIEKIKEEYKIDFGSGYPSDERTIEFLENIIRNEKELPKFIRKSWFTVKRLGKKKLQAKIKYFLDSYNA
ncbi:MAG: ribonuclease HII [Candidatus Aenigmatarchaeota archaeon]|nr:ribonuclease HII [Candidatus Aenigmarchaeota archaeon]